MALEEKWAYSTIEAETSGAIFLLPVSPPFRILRPVAFFFLAVGQKEGSFRNKLAVDRDGAVRAPGACPPPR